MIDFYNDTTPPHTPTVSKEELNDEQVLNEINRLKEKLKDEVIVLGHHYQQDDVIEFADHTGDSLKLARDAAKLKSPYIIFCGVHFMAETADMLTSEDQKVILPDMNAGCSMADMADRVQIDKAWENITRATKQKIIPITYINCTAALKSFVGENGGSICTSSNAHKVISWALEQGEKLLFFPDQHLGRNTCFDLGIPLEDMAVYNPNMLNGGLTDERIAEAKVLLWYGYCSVHQGFNVKQIEAIKKKEPETKIIVHPECSFDVVQAADLNGSTAHIIETIKASPAGSKWAVGTEINLVNRLQAQFPDKTVNSLSPYQCLCTTMYRVRPRWLLATFRSIERKQAINVISVPADIKENALKALDQMLQIS